MSTNSGEGKVRLVAGTRAKEMRCYDRLPGVLRREVAKANEQFSCSEILEAYLEAKEVWSWRAAAALIQEQLSRASLAYKIARANEMRSILEEKDPR